MLEDLANSRYLIQAYAASSDSWENFRLTARSSSLHEVAFALCGAWTNLSEDDDFFAALGEACDRVQSQSPRLKGAERREFELYRDVDRLLSRELVILAQAGMEARHAVRLVTDLGMLLGEKLEPPSKEDISLLHTQAKDLAEELCEADKRLRGFDYDPAAEVPAGRPPHRGWSHRMKRVGKALDATAGVAGAAGNVAGAIVSFGVASGLGLASVVAGAEATRRAVRDLRGDDTGDTA